MIKALGCLFTLLAILFGANATAAYPDRPIRIIVPFTPGDGPDVIARLIGSKISARLGQSVVIENKAGASGQIALTELKRAEPDGYTMALGLVTNLALAPHAYKSVPYDPLKDFTPVALLGANYLALVTSPDSQFKTLADMIAWARANPGKLSIGTTSIGGFPHMSFELLGTLAGFSFVNVAYKGNGPIISDLLGGRIEGGFSSYTGFAPLIQAGKLRLLGITNPGADPLLPDLPVMGDTVKGYGSLGWFGLVAPTGTPAPIVNQLNREINDAMALEDVRQTMQKLGMTPAMISPQAFGEIMTNDYNKFGKLVRDIGFERQ